MEKSNIKVGIIGSGFISLNLINSFAQVQGFKVSAILTRRPPGSLKDFPLSHLLTNSLNELIDKSDVIVECCGDVIYVTEVIAKILQAALPVVTLDAQFHITTGSYFIDKGLITESEGDQPGSLASLHREVTQMGFRPLVYGSFKGFLNTDPSREDMIYWAGKQGISLHNVTSFTDGTKLHIEQVLVANGLGADILSGMIGPKEDVLKTAAQLLAEAAELNGNAISDYILSPKNPHGVFVVATHDRRQADVLYYLKMGEGPYYTIVKNNIFAHLEVFRTIEMLLNTKTILLNNSRHPKYSVAAIAKVELKPGEKIECGMGSFQLRGETVSIAAHPAHVPIGLIYNATVRRNLSRGDILTFDDIDLPDSMALDIWSQIAATSGKALLKTAL